MTSGPPGCPLWEALAPPAPALDAFDGDARTDVVIVGAGMLGLSLALHLREAGMGATVLEADTVGAGASGRNTGFVVPSLRTAIGPEEVRKRMGQAGEALNTLVGGSATLVFDLARRHAIDCAAERTGWLQPAHTAAMARILDLRAREWRARGRPVEMLDAAETARRSGLTGYQGALFDPEGGQIDPLAFTRGLACAARRLGAKIHERARVTGLAAENGGWVATTRHGRIIADRAFLATNALGAGIDGPVAASLVPVVIHQIATQRLDAALRARVLPAGAPVADTRRHTFAVRWAPDGRLVSGGLVAPGSGALERAGRFFARRLARFFPDAGPLVAEFAWSGTIAKTIDDLPRFFELAPGFDAAVGCNGRGVALTTALGHAIARRYAGATEFPLPVSAPRPIPGRSLARHGQALWLKWSGLRDWLDTRLT